MVALQGLRIVNCSGTAVQIDNAAEVSIIQCALTNNAVSADLDGKGGALRATASHVSIDDSTFVSNHASVSGGAIHCSETIKLTVRNSYFDNNTVGWCISAW